MLRSKCLFISVVILLLSSGCSFNSPDLSNIKNSDLPILYIDVSGANIQHIKREKGQLFVINKGLNISSLSTEDISEYDIRIKQRGYTSMGIPKSQFGFKIENEAGKLTAIEILDIPPGISWVLHGPYIDKSLIRNQLAYRIWENMGHYSVRSQFVELYMRHRKPKRIFKFENRYHGIYLLVEKIEKSLFRLNLQTPEKFNTYDDISFIIELLPDSRLETVDDFFKTDLWKTNYTFIYPKDKKQSDDIKLNDQFKSLSKDFMDHMEQAFLKPEIKGEDPEFSKFLDVDSFVDYAIFAELSNNPDSYFTSDFFYKDINGKLKAGPVWDYNTAFGNNSWTTNAEMIILTQFDRPFIKQLMSSSYFITRYKNRWLELRREDIISADAIFALIDKSVSEIQQAQVRNFDKYDMLGKSINDLPIEIPQTFEGEIEYLKNFISIKISTIDKYVNTL